MNKMRLIQPSIAIPKYRQLRLPTVAAEFSQYIEVEINDENIEPLDLSDVDLVGLTCQTYNAHRAFYISQQFRKMGIKTIIGGVFATAMPEKALNYFDSVVIGEVEGLGKDIIQDFNQGTLQKVYQNKTPPDLSNTNLPRFDLLKNEKYYQFNFPIETSRGCPHRCNFCFNSYQYPKFRTRSLTDIERDLAQHDHGIIEVIDLHFAGNKKFLFEVCDVFQSMNVVSWFGEATIMSLNDEETLKRLADSNCRMVFVGLESISKNTLAGINKSFNNVQHYKRIIHMCQDYGIFIHAGFIWGLEGQDQSTYEETLKFCESSKIYLAGSNLLTYFPGTAIFDQTQKANQIIEENYQYYDSAHLTVKTESITPEDILDGVVYFNKHFYSFRSMFKRAFQHPNNNLMLLSDYMGFNYVYRSYYQSWTQKVKQGIESLDNKDDNHLIDENSQPLLYKNVPVTYQFFDYIWRYWNYWFQKFNQPAHPAELEYIFQSLIAYIISLLISSGLPSEFSLMVRSPSTMLILFNYGLLWGAASMVLYCISGWIKRKKFLCLFGIIFLIPVICFPFNASTPGFSIMTILAMINTVYFLKIISFFSSSERFQASYFRFYLFLFFSPSLDYDTSFQLDFRNNTFSRSLGISFLGIIQILLAIVSLAAIMYLFAFFPHIHNMFKLNYWLITSLKCLYCYLVFAGIMNLITGYWKLWGYKTESVINWPLLARSPKDFWRRINRTYCLWSQKNIAGSLEKKQTGHVFISTMTPFLISASLCVYVFGVSDIPIYIPEWRATLFHGLPWPLLCFCFFIVNGLAVYIEKIFGDNQKQLNRSNRFFILIQTILTLLLIIVTSTALIEVSDQLFIN